MSPCPWHWRQEPENVSGIALSAWRKAAICAQQGRRWVLAGGSWGCSSRARGCQALDLFISQLSFQEEDTGQHGSKCGKHTDHSLWNLGVNLKMGTHQSWAMGAVSLQSLSHNWGCWPFWEFGWLCHSSLFDSSSRCFTCWLNDLGA